MDSIIVNLGSPDSTNTDKQENANVKRDEQEEEKPTTTSSFIDDSNYQSKGMRATTDDDNQIFLSMIVIANIENKRIHKNPSHKRSKQTEDYNGHQSEETIETVVSDEDLNAICERCRYTFCKKCNELFHSQTMCPKDYLIEQLKLEKRNLLERLQQNRQAMLARLAENGEKKLLSKPKLTERTYHQIVIKLSEQDTLLQELMSAHRVTLLDAQYCPRCHVPIEKNGGCSHMYCTRCNYSFTWSELSSPVLARIPFLAKDGKNFVELESAKEEIYKVASLVETSEQEAHLEQAKEDNEEDIMISIDNQSNIGSAILRRVKPCPNDECKKINVKVTQDNWMVCSACMKQYCFLCGRDVNGPSHYGKKCFRHTAV